MHELYTAETLHHMQVQMNIVNEDKPAESKHLDIP